ncbi:MAG: hypothetical protein ACK40M_07445 [Flavobacteriales bacterium]
MSKSTDPVLIPKEKIAALRFPEQEVKSCPEEMKSLRHKLYIATTLGNLNQHKCRITFSDEEGVKAVETTIWATAEQRIVLKYGLTIPIHRIHDVNVYVA